MIAGADSVVSRGRLKIALVVHDLNRHHGHSRYVAELASRFKNDHEVHIFANTFDDPDTSGLTLHRIPCWRPNALGSILSFVAPATFLVRGDFDVVHAQGLCGLRHDVATAHMIQPAWHQGLARAAGRLSFKQRVAAWMITPLERRALTNRCVRRVIAISDRVRDDLATYYGRRNGVTVVYHGVDLETFHPRNREPYRHAVRREIGVADEDFLGLFVGNLQKGAAAAIAAVARVPAVKLALVSSSDAGAERALVRRLGLEDRVRFVPFSKQVNRFYAAADVLVFPTIYDPFGLVITEAMASGLPVITSRAAGAAELIRHDESGLLTDEPWNVEQIAQALSRLAGDASRPATMGRNARSAVESRTWDRTAAETLDVYREVIAERRSATER